VTSETPQHFIMASSASSGETPTTVATPSPGSAVECFVECGTTGPPSLFVPNFRVNFSKWMCRPCHAAHTAIKRACREDDSLATHWSKVQKLDHSGFKAAVRDIRGPGGCIADRPGTENPRAQVARGQQIAQLKQQQARPRQKPDTGTRQ
jgi:hypothetical protein